MRGRPPGDRYARVLVKPRVPTAPLRRARGHRHLLTGSAMLVVGAAIVGRSLLAMMRVDLGYDPTHVITFQIGTPEAIAYGTRGRLTRLYDELLARLRAHPGVVSVGTSTARPLAGRRQSVERTSLPYRSRGTGLR